MLVARARTHNSCLNLTDRAHTNDWLQIIYHIIKKGLASCNLSANIRERRHLQLPAALEVERLQR